jgi:hypothetical protein
MYFQRLLSDLHGQKRSPCIFVRSCYLSYGLIVWGERCAEIASHSVAQADPKLMEILLRDRTIGVSDHAWLAVGLKVSLSFSLLSPLLGLSTTLRLILQCLDRTPGLCLTN